MKTEREEYTNRYRDKLKKIYSLTAVVLIAMIITMATGSLGVENTVLQLENSIVNDDNDNWWNLFAPRPIPTSMPSSSVTISAGEYTNVGGYTLWIGINSEKSPRETWIFLLKDGMTLDDKILKVGDVYIYKPNDEILFQATVGTIFSGALYDAVRLDNIYTNEPSTGTSTPTPSTPSSSVTIEAEEYTVVGGYMLWVSVDAYKSPRETRIFLLKDGVTLDDKILKEGDVYIYKPNDEIIFQATVGMIFSGEKSDLIRLDNIYTNEI